jgi:hypothetical protein
LGFSYWVCPRSALEVSSLTGRTSIPRQADRWYFRRELNGLIQILSFDENESAYLLVRFSEGAIRQKYFAVSDPHRSGRLDGLQGMRRQEMPAFPKSLAERARPAEGSR